jgi:hypothetical protein
MRLFMLDDAPVEVWTAVPAGFIREDVLPLREREVLEETVVL